MRSNTIKILNLLVLFLTSTILAQELPTIIPPAPEAASFAKFSDIPISHYSGVPNISVPISSYSVGDKSFPVGISYHARGVKVNEIASRVGLGWALNAGGQVTRQVRHKADDGYTGYQVWSGIHADVFVNGTTDLSNALATQFAPTCDCDYDRLPDLFTLQGGGLSTKFIFNYADGLPLVQKYDDIIVEYVTGSGTTVSSGITGFIVTDKDGYKYYYGVDSSMNPNNPIADVNWTYRKYTFMGNGNYNVVNPDMGQVSDSEAWAYAPYYNTWHLTEVVSPNGDSARLIYNKETNYVYRRSGDKDQVGGNQHNSTDLVRMEQYQLEEIQYNFDANGDYTKIVFEADDPRADMYSTADDNPDIGSSDAWPSDAKELDAVKIYKQGSPVSGFELNKTFNLSHHYMVSNDNNGPLYNYLPLLVTMNPSASKRLVLDAITEIGSDGSAKPPYVFTYDSTLLPNRHSNSQDYWGYYNGADNGYFLTGNGDRRIDTTLAQAGMLKKITYPTGGSTRFNYEHNRGRKGDEYDGIHLPDINPTKLNTMTVANISPYTTSGGIYGGGYYEGHSIYTVNSRTKFDVSASLPPLDLNEDGDFNDEGENQNIACTNFIPGQSASVDCAFRILLVPLDENDDPIQGEVIPIWTDSPPMWVNPGRYRLELHVPPNWDFDTNNTLDHPFIISLIGQDQVVDEDNMLYAAGKRIQQIEFLDENDSLVSKRTYDYKNSGVILGISDFDYSYGTSSSGTPISFEAYSLFNTYQGNAIGYKLVDEYYGDKEQNYGKKMYNFTIQKDTGDFVARPRTPATDNEWLRGLPLNIIDYVRKDDGSYYMVKQVEYKYLMANDDHTNILTTIDFMNENSTHNPILTPETVIYDIENVPPTASLPDIFYDETRTNFRLPFVWWYFGNEFLDEVEGERKIKIFHFTGGTLDTKEVKETLYDGNGNTIKVTKSNTNFNYNNHYQPVQVTSVSSDGKPIIQTFSYPQDLVDTLPITEENIIAQDLIDQNRLVPLETRTYKDLNNDGLPGFGITDELLSTTKTKYSWFNENTILEPMTIYTSKANDPLEARINFEQYNSRGDILQVSKEDGASISYIWGYDQTLPVAKIENATYSAITSLPSFSGGTLLSGSLSPTQESELRTLPNAVVTTYTYEEGVGLKTVTNARGHTMTYNYDGFNRLKNILDEDGYLVSENEYNYMLTSNVQNYVKNTTYLVETFDGNDHAITGNPLTDDDKMESITYFDGLGRGLQSIAKQAGGNREDIITSMGYDEYGRQLREYLPYARTNSTLDFDASLLPDDNGNITALNTQYLSKYADDLAGIVNPYSEKVVENSPLGRVMEQAAPGSDWAVGNGHTIKFEYEANTLNTLDPFDSANNTYDNVILFDVAHPTESNVLNTEKTELVYIGHYDANTLYKTITKDENWTSGKDHTTEEFTNKQGQVILKRTFNDNEPHDTYYIYDDFGNLTYVLPPTAVDEILELDTGQRVASQINYPWVKMANVDKAFAEEYNRKLSDYDNTDILNADIENAYGGQGGFTVSTLEDSEQVLLSISFSATQALELKKGELISLKPYGNFKNTELGRITGNGYSYTFYINDDAIHIDGYGKLNGINQVFDSTSKLAYDQDILWTRLVNVDKKFASAHESEVLNYVKGTGENPLNVYLENEFGGRGGLNITIDENDNMVLSFNISSTVPLALKQGVIANLDSKRRFKNRYLGTLTSGSYSYDFSLVDNSITVRGSGSGLSFSGVMFPVTLTDPTHTVRTEVIEGLCYIYHYDYRNRLIEKKIPGKGWEHIVYDKLDRPVLTQDAKMRLDNDWLFTKYDVLGRATYTGKYSYAPQASEENSGRLELQATANSQTLLYETKTTAAQTINGSAVHYTNNAFPNAASLELLTINYYDDYDNSHLDTTELIKQQGDMVFDEAIDTNAKLLTTTSQVRVLGTDDWITSVSYFDADDMPIYVASKNEYLNTSDVVVTDYDFIGKVLQTQSTHVKDSNDAIVITDIYNYDHKSRLLTQTQTINNSTPELIVNNHYDEYGLLDSKNVGGAATGSGLQTVDYSYNIRGWLKSVNDGLTNGTDLFGFRLNYNTAEQSGATALYNGNISEMYWANKVADGSTQSQAYDYNYDALNRLTSANYHLLNSGASNDYSLNQVEYDKNGNISVLKRTGLVDINNGIATFDIIDALSYTYEPLSNKLLEVHDTAVDKGFKDDNEENNDIDYLYDINGSLTKDLNKGILDIIYNHLNLPTVVTVDNGETNGTITYTYDATGIKLAKHIEEYPTEETRTTKTTEYAGAYIYEKTGSYSYNGQFWVGNEIDHGIKLITTPEGYVQPIGGNNFEYVYNLSDHLGNIRVTYMDSNQNNTNPVNIEIVELNSYYPYGMTMEYENNYVSSYANSVARKFKYNGIEHEEALGLDLYEMDVRHYDAAIARWTGIDPVTHHSMSTYLAFDGNPVYWADPSGADAINEFGHDVYWQGALATTPHEERVNNNEEVEEENNSRNEKEIREVNITITDNIVGTGIVRSYPHPNPNPPDNEEPEIYEVPLYEMIVTGTDANGVTKTYNYTIVRFGVQKNENTGIGPRVVGLADAQTHTLNWVDYMGGSWQVYGNFLIHEGADDPTTSPWGSLGCVEVCGVDGWENFNNNIKELAGSNNEAEIANSGKLQATYEAAERPALVRRRRRAGN